MQEGETGTVAGSILDPDSPYGEQEDADLLKIDSSSGSGSHQTMQAKQIKKKKEEEPFEEPFEKPSEAHHTKAARGFILRFCRPGPPECISLY